ncbi:hypothetical protein L7F22_043434 [Adiantum nelumboides]|nr:hypothetical protein [Adiantum nelumboides]
MGWAPLPAPSSPAPAIIFLIILLSLTFEYFSAAAALSSSNGDQLLHMLTHPHFTPAHITASLRYRQSVSHNHVQTSTTEQSYGASYSYKTLFYTQTLDHFSFTPFSYHTFQQRYLVNDEHWGGARRRAPIFVYCGNEGDIEWFANNTGFMWEIAPLYSAMVVFMEHRYYGQSIPDIAQANHTAETLGYLTSEQALADYAGLLRDFKRNRSAEDSPVVLFGGSYGGMLAAWFRLKYPHIAIGALASSAPILHFDDVVPIDGFYRIVSEDFKNASTSCFETIRDSWDALSAAFEENGGQERVAKLFGFCSNVSADLSSVQDFLYTAWVYMAMTDYPYPANFLQPMPANPVETACRAMDSLPPGSDILARIVAGANVYYNGTGVSCFQLASDPHGLALWSWQACTEMVMPMTSNPNNSMFPASGYSLQSTIRSCSDFFGVTPRPHWITLQFGGPDIRQVLKRFGSNIIFSNGLLDPWSNGGVLSDISDSIVALVTTKGAHHVDLRAATASDPDWLVQQREDEKKHISRWLRLYYADYRAAHRPPT